MSKTGEGVRTHSDGNIWQFVIEHDDAWDGPTVSAPWIARACPVRTETIRTERTGSSP